MFDITNLESYLITGFNFLTLRNFLHALWRKKNALCVAFLWFRNFFFVNSSIVFKYVLMWEVSLRWTTWLKFSEGAWCQVHITYLRQTDSAGFDLINTSIQYLIWVTTVHFNPIMIDKYYVCFIFLGDWPNCEELFFRGGYLWKKFFQDKNS